MDKSGTAKAGYMLTLFVGAIVSAQSAIASASSTVISIEPHSEAVIFRAKSASCAIDYKPDSPARFFMRSDKRIVAIAGHIINYEMVGSSVDSLSVNCYPVLSSEQSEDPSKMSDRSWIAATWTGDGKNVRALVHDEYQAHRFPGRCKYKSYIMCWYNTITSYQSSDGGRNFTKAANIFAIGPYLRFDGSAGRHIGFYNPSNIIQDGSFIYTYVFTNGFLGQNPGVCLFRSRYNVSSPWFGWDGSKFSVKMQNPYLSNIKPEHCKTLPYFVSVVGSVVRRVDTGMYLAVTSSDEKDGTVHFSYSESNNLTNWSPLRKLVDLPTMWSKNCNDTFRYGYPSMVSSTPLDRNFSLTKDDGYLFLTRFHIKDCKLSEDRDLVRFKYHIY